MKSRLSGIRNSLAIVLMAALSACAHGTMRGTVAMKASDSEAHVCLGENEVKAGDRLSLFRNDCRAVPAGYPGSFSSPCVTRVPGTLCTQNVATACIKVRVGAGTVERVVSEHYSVVKIDPGVPFDEGTIVEKD